MHLTVPSNWSRSIGTGGRDASERLDAIVVTRRLHRIRHYGLFAKGKNRAANIARARQLLAVPRSIAQLNIDPDAESDQPRALPKPCPCCGGCHLRRFKPAPATSATPPIATNLMQHRERREWDGPAALLPPTVLRVRAGAFQEKEDRHASHVHD